MGKIRENDSAQSVLIRIAITMAQIEEENIANKPKLDFFSY